MRYRAILNCYRNIIYIEETRSKGGQYHVDTMENIYNHGKSMEELFAIIDTEYIARIKK